MPRTAVFRSPSSCPAGVPLPSRASMNTNRPQAASARRCALVIVALLGATRPAIAADGAWTFIPPQAGPDSLPGPRIGGGRALDPDPGRLIFFRGRPDLPRGSAASPPAPPTAGGQLAGPTPA